MTQEEILELLKQKGIRGDSLDNVIFYQDEKIVAFQGVSFLIYRLEGVWYYERAALSVPFEGYVDFYDLKVCDEQILLLKNEALLEIAQQYQKTPIELREIGIKNMRCLG